MSVGSELDESSDIWFQYPYDVLLLLETHDERTTTQYLCNSG